MNPQQILQQKDSILICLLLLFCFHISGTRTENEEFLSLERREIEPPFGNSGVGDRQSGFRRLLHEQLERLTHDELKNEAGASKDNEAINKKEEEQKSFENTIVKQNEHNSKVEKKKRQNEEQEENGGAGNHGEQEVEAEEEAERAYNPWQDSFQDIFEDGTYAYGYNLPNGVTRYERSFYSEKFKGLVVEGFYTQPRHFGKRILYELRCYRSDYYSGYRPLGVQYLRRQPFVQRDTEPDVDCFDKD